MHLRRVHVGGQAARIESRDVTTKPSGAQGRGLCGGSISSIRGWSGGRRAIGGRGLGMRRFERVGRSLRGAAVLMEFAVCRAGRRVMWRKRRSGARQIGLLRQRSRALCFGCWFRGRFGERRRGGFGHGQVWWDVGVGLLRHICEGPGRTLIGATGETGNGYAEGTARKERSRGSFWVGVASGGEVNLVWELGGERIEKKLA